MDELLRHSVLVDPYPVVLQGMVIGTPSYSLNYVEKLYMPPRSGDVVSAGRSVVEYQKWLDAGELEDPALSPIRASTVRRTCTSGRQAAKGIVLSSLAVRKVEGM